MVKRPGNVQLAFQCPTEVAAKLKELSERTMIPQARLLRRGIELLFAEYPDAAVRHKPITKGRK